ncbi:MAG: ChbG/HpnK family deacetylase [Candidatus Omnitrophota bacterium]|nr:ChbG/HpnK family deacetylase [Candidatus Omnitrophota bacterium]
MKYLIVTADDLGLAKSINEGIAKACREGIVSSVSVIPTGEAFTDALKVIKDLNLKEIGAHLALTETKPVKSTSKFYKNHNRFFKDIFFKAFDLEEIRKELKAQLELLKRTGVRITHINSHEHIHMMPELLNIFISLAKEFDIPALRYPRGDRPARAFSMNDLYKKSVLSYFSNHTAGLFKDSGLLYTDHFLGLLDTGRLKEDILIEMLGGLEDGVTELVCHPGFLSPEVLDRYKWHIGAEAELFALTDPSVKNAIRKNEIRLITYEQLSSVKG